MLLVKRCDYGRIAEEVEISEDAVRIYSETFWNVRDRLHESIYISSILYPDTTQITWAVDYHLMESPAMLALRIAHRHGWKAAKEFLGSAFAPTTIDASMNAKTLESRIMAEAVHMLDLGFVHQPGITAIQSGRALIQSSKLGGEQQKSTDDAVGLGRLGMGNTLLNHFQAFMDTEVQHRLQIQRQQMDVKHGTDSRVPQLAGGERMFYGEQFRPGQFQICERPRWFQRPLLFIARVTQSPFLLMSMAPYPAKKRHDRKRPAWYAYLEADDRRGLV